MMVSDFMNPSPATVSEDATLAETLGVMAAQKKRHVVVMQGEEDVAGIVSDSDLAMYYDPVSMTPDKWQQMKVSQMMSPDPVTIGSQAPIEEAAKLLLKTGVSALPVVENGILRGILTETDFVRHFAN
jgi:acetoin utilization protein AcuB